MLAKIMVDIERLRSELHHLEPSVDPQYLKGLEAHVLIIILRDLNRQHRPLFRLEKSELKGSYVGMRLED